MKHAIFTVIVAFGGGFLSGFVFDWLRDGVCR